MALQRGQRKGVESVCSEGGGGLPLGIGGSSRIREPSGLKSWKAAGFVPLKNYLSRCTRACIDDSCYPRDLSLELTRPFSQCKLSNAGWLHRIISVSCLPADVDTSPRYTPLVIVNLHWGTLRGVVELWRTFLLLLLRCSTCNCMYDCG